MALKNGAIMAIVIIPHVAFAHQWGSIWRSGIRAKVNISVITATERMEYTRVILNSCISSLRQLPCGAEEGRLMAKSLSICMMSFDRCFSSLL